MQAAGEAWLTHRQCLFFCVSNGRFGHIAESHERLLDRVELRTWEAASRERLLTLRCSLS